jgi:ubiquinone/menaquinone biosynthesis C-methylase UbiE
MELSPQIWHDRYTNQARWTQPLRHHIYSRLKISHAEQILEVGCGSGAILSDFHQHLRGTIVGLDLDIEILTLAMRNAPNAILFQADAHHIPLPTEFFDFSICHFLLLWVANPRLVINEMKRVTHPGGIICALAEPDYGGRIDYPPEFTELGKKQSTALHNQGANPEIGRQLRKLFSNAGLVDVVTGVIGGQWELPFLPGEWESEWEMLEYDLAANPDFTSAKEKLKAQDKIAWAQGERILYVPTFYAWGKVPG